LPDWKTDCTENAMRRFTRTPALLVLGCTAAFVTFAQAQSPGPNRAPDQNAPGQFDAQSGRERDQTLSERLDRSGGVIHPPGNVDPQMQVKPPATGDKMPVVPAPGSPGGDPNVKPK
jgi:hypothetical protein